jgi:phage terminase large subunit GpA-like protein
MCASQLFKTEAILNFLGYIISLDPGPVLIVEPREEDAKTLSKDRVAPMLRDTPELQGKIASSRERDSDNTVLHKSFRGGHVTFVGAKSPSGLAMRPIRYCLLDECDRYPKTAGVEGSPIRLAIRRTDEFAWNKKILLASTPTIEGASVIAAAYEDSDQRKPYVPCPFCNHLQILVWSNVRWPKGKPLDAYYVCESCREEIPGHKKAWMLAHGKWITLNPESRTPGFWISQLYSSRKTWGSLAEEYVEVEKHPEQLKTFINTVLAETFRERGEAPEYKRLYDRRETWKIGTVPMGGLFLVAGVDVQGDRIEIQVKAFGRNKENWTVDYAVLSSSRTTEAQVWKDLTTFLNRTYRHESGVDLHIARVAIDSGANTQEVYSWARTQGPGRVIVVKGFSSGAAVLGTPTAVDINSKGKRQRRSVKVWPVNVSMLKEELYGWLRLEKPNDEELANGSGYPAGYCHYPQFDEEFFKQLTAEELVTRVVKGYRVSAWQKTRDRNEALDTHNYARAAAAHVGIDRFNERDWRALEATFAESTTVEVFAQPAPESNNAPAPAPVPVPKPMPVAQPTAAPRPTQQPYQPIRSNWMNR